MNETPAAEAAPIYLTVPQLADRWETTPNAIYTDRSRRRGNYPRSFRLRGRVVFLLSDVLAQEKAHQMADSRFNPELDPTLRASEPKRYSPAAA
ncbi:DNA-binding protein [Streptomyces sp. NPDC001194]|uniref:DNA-binding protein n=1 Tax=Streptomyces sp. NPDC001194 TaxID=3364547 RepID=UPI0036C59CAF